jgi:fumarate reductase flavoprotein subunit
MELGPRDRLSQAFVKEFEKGRTIDGPYGAVVHLDLRHLGDKLINQKLPFVRELCLKYEGLDPVSQLIPVRPVVHYMMGGISTDINGATPIPGLYAAGECACVSINGANRLGSNSLPEILVFGARAGKAAAEYSGSVPDTVSAAILAQANDERRRLEQEFLHKTGGTERVANIRDAMQKALENGAGIYRNEKSLREAAQKLDELQERAKSIALDDHSRTFNTELLSALELNCMLDVATCMVHSALHRTESRGAHQRTDYPARDDRNFLAHTMISRTPDGSIRIDYKPIVITRWAPGERVYGQTETAQAAKVLRA